MNPLIFNRDEFKHPADGWYHIEAKGEHLNEPAGVVQVVDGAAMNSIVNKFNAGAKDGTLRHGHEMLIDREHWKEDPSKETTAYGWLHELQARPDGIYGKIRWTGTGQEAVDGGDYRFFSTEYDRADCKLLNNGSPPRLRPLKLDGLTLTNMNNNRGQKAITNRAAPEGRDSRAGNATSQDASGAAMVNAAARLFNQLVSAEQGVTNSPASAAWNIVANREPGLHALAKGRWSPHQVFAAHPALEPRLKLYNRAAEAGDVSDSAAANTIAPKALEFLAHQTEATPADAGYYFQQNGASPRAIWASFHSQVKRMMTNEQLTCQQAFNKLKQTQPMFWKMAMLSFEPAMEWQE